jgi:tetratricopeptide (TPR) repeat protein
MMRRDCFGSEHSTQCAEAVAAFERAVWVILRHQPHVTPILETARALDPAMPAVDALHGLAMVMLARSDLHQEITRLQAACRAKLTVAGGGSALERALFEGLEHARCGRLRAASDVLAAHACARPDAIIAAKLAYSLRFISGDAAGMLGLTSQLVGNGSSHQPGFSYILGCHSFALEEVGRYDEAEQTGRAAVELAPDDAWGMHAVGHVYEMRGQVVEGINWLVQHRAAWSGCNNFKLHMAWHQALLHLERGEFEVALSLYDKDIHPAASSDFRDVANAVSMLLRLEQSGVAVGATRWTAVAEDAAARASDATLVFASLHSLMALIRARRLTEAGELVECLHMAAHGSGDQAKVAGQVGADMARALLDWARGAQNQSGLQAISRRLAQIGGSRVQRDIFVRALIVMADEAGDGETVHGLLASRRTLRRNDLFARQLLGTTSRRGSPVTQLAIHSLGELGS